MGVASTHAQLREMVAHIRLETLTYVISFSPDESEAWSSRSSVEKTIVHAVSVSCRKQACD